MRAKMTKQEQIKRAAIRLLPIRFKVDPKSKAQVAELSNILADFWGKYQHIMCQHWKVEPVDIDEWVEETINKPDKVITIVKNYDKLIGFEVANNTLLI